jgi:hypothetical protein
MADTINHMDTVMSIVVVVAMTTDMSMATITTVSIATIMIIVTAMNIRLYLARNKQLMKQQLYLDRVDQEKCTPAVATITHTIIPVL